MLPQWETVIRPFVTAVGDGPLIEIGAASGETTAELAELAVAGSFTLHTVEPDPEFDVAEYERRFGVSFRFHREKSHEALERIEPAAAVLIDGDHNWYTVHGELTRLERVAGEAGRLFPLVILHDVEWPYARRDMYYDPEAIPERWRQPWDRRGIRWGESSLCEAGTGVNPHLANALEEGGERNGVLTAVEDFMAESDLDLELRVVSGEAGLGVLVCADLLRANPAVTEQWERLRAPEFLLDQTRRLAELATRMQAAWIEAARAAAREGP